MKEAIQTQIDKIIKTAIECVKPVIENGYTAPASMFHLTETDNGEVLTAVNDVSLLMQNKETKREIGKISRMIYDQAQAEGFNMIGAFLLHDIWMSSHPVGTDRAAVPMPRNDPNRKEAIAVIYHDIETTKLYTCEYIREGKKIIFGEIECKLGLEESVFGSLIPEKK
jgi:hypothetical protein